MVLISAPPSVTAIGMAIDMGRGQPVELGAKTGFPGGGGGFWKGAHDPLSSPRP